MSNLTPQQREAIRAERLAKAAAAKAELRERIRSEAALDERAYDILREAGAKGEPITLAEARRLAAPKPAAKKPEAKPAAE